jgi:hypothetical protein
MVDMLAYLLIFAAAVAVAAIAGRRRLIRERKRADRRAQPGYVLIRDGFVYRVHRSSLVPGDTAYVIDEPIGIPLPPPLEVPSSPGFDAWKLQLARELRYAAIVQQQPNPRAAVIITGV